MNNGHYYGLSDLILIFEVEINLINTIIKTLTNLLIIKIMIIYKHYNRYLNNQKNIRKNFNDG